MSRMTRTRAVLVLFGALAIVLATLSFLPQLGAILQARLLQFAIAIVISIVLALTVQRYARDEFRDEVDRALERTRVAVLEAAYSKMVPEEVFEEVRDLIFDQPFLRKNANAVVTLEWPQNGDKNHLVFETVVSFEMHNVSKHPQTYSFYAENTRPNRPDLSDKIWFRRLVIKDGVRILMEHGPDELERTVDRESDTHILLRHNIEIPEGESRTIETHDLRWIEWKDYYTLKMGFPTIDLSLYVHHPEDIGVKLTLNHPREERLREILSNRTTNAWKLEGAILPYQGLEFFWQPLPDGEPEAPAME